MKRLFAGRLGMVAPGFWLKAALPGLLLAVAVAIAGDLTGRLFGLYGVKLPAIVCALIIGMLLHRAASGTALQPGLTFSAKVLLRWAIALLGLRILFSDIVSLGAPVALLVVATMALSILSGLAAARLFGRSASFGALAGGATAVCGASAALAISTVLPPSRDREADAAFTVLAVNALSTVAMLAYPLLARELALGESATGVLLGASIHDVAQVVGAGYSVSAQAGDTAVIVKLFRVFLLLPVVLVIGYAFAARSEGAGRARVPVPVFALVFLLLAAINSLGLVPDALRAVLLEFSRWGLLVAIAALGVKTSIHAMTQLGWRHLAVVTFATVVLLVLVTLPLVWGWV